MLSHRSHPAILEQPNKMFYFEELQVFADKMERESLCQWSELPKKGFPVIFHGVVGKNYLPTCVLDTHLANVARNDTAINCFRK